MRSSGVLIEDLGNGRAAAKGYCRKCGQPQRVEAAEAALLDYWCGMHIQDALPNLTENEREWLISGTCGPCFDAIWEEATA